MFEKRKNILYVRKINICFIDGNVLKINIFDPNSAS